jgi:ABC-2 type transport system ATP-binding protein
MTTAIEITDLSRRYGSTDALTDVSFDVEQDTICGLLGRNGAGKTTTLSVVAGQERPSGGRVRVFGHDPADDSRVASRTSFVKDDQRWPDDFRLREVLAVGPAFHRGWDAELARSLAADLRVPEKTPVKKMSRGQASAVAIVIGVASRAPLTIFDEPYLGLDATARQLFYDRLLADYSEHPRTILLSTHLIDEMESLLEHVVVLDQGQVRLDCDVDDARASAYSVAGTTRSVTAFLAGRTVLSSHGIGGLTTAVVEGAADERVRADAAAAGVELSPVGLQQVVAALGAASAASSAVHHADDGDDLDGGGLGGPTDDAAPRTAPEGARS